MDRVHQFVKQRVSHSIALSHSSTNVLTEAAFVEGIRTVSVIGCYKMLLHVFVGCLIDLQQVEMEDEKEKYHDVDG